MYWNYMNAHDDGNIQSQFGIFSLFFRLFDFNNLNNMYMYDDKAFVFWFWPRFVTDFKIYVFNNCSFFGFLFDFDFPFSRSFQSNIQPSKHSLIKFCESPRYFKWNELENKYFLYNSGWFFIVNESRFRFRHNYLCMNNLKWRTWKIVENNRCLKILKWKNCVFNTQVFFFSPFLIFTMDSVWSIWKIEIHV